MGQLTRAQIVTEGLNLAGNTGLTTRANYWLNTFLGSIYPSHRWSFLERRYTAPALTAGGASLSFGAGSVTSDLISHVLRIALADTSNDGYKNDIWIADGESSEASNEPAWLSSTRGLPNQLMVEPDATTQFKWTISPSGLADKAYRLSILAQYLPTHIDVTSGGDNTKPVYPNDETMMHAIYVQALRHQSDERAVPEEEILASKVRMDRLKFGRRVGTAQKIGLSRRTFTR